MDEKLVKLISKIYEPNDMINLQFGRNDIMLQTDKEGKAIRMFIGTIQDNGMIRGDRYTRTIVKDREGAILKDYWERKGKAS